MKSILTLVAVAMIGYSASAQNTPAKPTPATVKKADVQPAKASSDVKPAAAETKQADGITFKSKEVNKTDIKYGADETFTFEFKNTSKTPVIVSNVQTSCGCTTANKPTEPVQPGKSSEISVKYDTKRVGPFTKTITVTTNVGEPIVLTIKGSVLPQESTGATTAPAQHNH